MDATSGRALCEKRVREAATRIFEILGSNLPEILSIGVIQHKKLGEFASPLIGTHWTLLTLLKDERSGVDSLHHVMVTPLCILLHHLLESVEFRRYISPIERCERQRVRRQGWASDTQTSA